MNTPQVADAVKANPFPGLVVGRSIHYVNGKGECCSATVSKVRQKKDGLIDVVVFGGVFLRSEIYPEAAVIANNLKHGKVTGQWHYMRECEADDQSYQ